MEKNLNEKVCNILDFRNRIGNENEIKEYCPDGLIKTILENPNPEKAVLDSENLEYITIFALKIKDCNIKECLKKLYENITFLEDENDGFNYLDFLIEYAQDTYKFINVLHEIDEKDLLTSYFVKKYILAKYVYLKRDKCIDPNERIKEYLKNPKSYKR